jgi:hypothetical protein
MSCFFNISMIASRDASPTVGLRPTMLLVSAGLMMLPCVCVYVKGLSQDDKKVPTSDPIDTKHNTRSVATAQPLLLPDRLIFR